MLSGVASSCPAMLGSATLTIVVSSTCMMVAAITAVPVNTRLVFIKLFQLHAHGCRRADAQRVLGIRRGELDAHRHALRDVHPVAGGVLRRQQRECRACAPAQAFHRCLLY